MSEPSTRVLLKYSELDELFAILEVQDGATGLGYFLEDAEATHLLNKLKRAIERVKKT